MRLTNKHLDKRWIKLLLIICLSLKAEALIAAQFSEDELLKTRSPREVIWSFDMSLLRHHLVLPDQSKLAGTGGSFTVGYGRTRLNSWLLGRFHFLAGPWDLARHETFDSDYFGTGMDIEYGSAFPGFSLRSGASPVLSLVAGYVDLNGKSIGGNRKNNGDPNDAQNYFLEQDFKSAFGAIMVTPSIGCVWAKPPRPTGNESELLVTRVESSYVKIGLQIPLYSRARVEVTKRANRDDVSLPPQRHTTTGVVRGYSLAVSTGVWLGI